MISKNTIGLIVSLLLSLPGHLLAADRVRDSDSVMFPSDITYDARFPTPETFLGHALGAGPVRHHQLVEYLQTIASMSDRMSVEIIGYSHEQRPILFLVITSPSNHEKIGEIRDKHVALTEPSMNQNVDDDMPVVTWLNYGHRVRDSDSVMFPSDITYDARFPTPETFLGHALGAGPVRHHQLVEYLQTIASMSDRMSVEIIGYSHEQRPILFLVITSPSNHEKIGEIRDKHVALTEPSMNQNVDDDMPVVTWLNYGVHGAESAGMDAALPTIYYLAAAQGPAIQQILEDSVILLTAGLCS